MRNLFINGLQIHSNVQDLGFVMYNNYTGFDNPIGRTPSYDKPGEHGEVVSNWLWGPRPMTIPGRVSGQTIGEYNLNKRSIQNAMRIIKDANGISQPILMAFETDDGLQLQANIFGQDQLQPVQIMEKSPNHADFILSIMAPDYRFYSQSVINDTINLPVGGGVVLPIIIPVTFGAATGGQETITNSGDENSPFVLTFYGPLTNPFITNLTTGESFATNIALGDGDKLEIDMAEKTMVLNDSSNALSSFVLTNLWMELIPGDNMIKLGSGLSSDVGYANINFRNAYLGI
jgi:hypothetical protein